MGCISAQNAEQEIDVYLDVLADAPVPDCRLHLHLPGVGSAKKTVLLLGESDVLAYSSESDWVPSQAPAIESDLPVVVLRVVIFTQPDHFEGIRVVLVMGNDLRTTTDNARLAMQSPALDQLGRLPPKFPPSDDQRILEFLAFPDLPL